MPHDVFICHASADKALAQTLCAKLEAEGIRCWIAPRDPVPGRSYSGQIVEAIQASAVVLLVFSNSINDSNAVLSELEVAFKRGIAIVPFRIADVVPSVDIEYYIQRTHWFDAISQPIEPHIDQLITKLRQMPQLAALQRSPTAAPATQPAQPTGWAAELRREPALDDPDLVEQARNGNPKAQLLMAQRLIETKTREGLAEGVALILLAAEQNFPEAEYVLGGLYEAGVFGEVNLQFAASWYEKAAELGYADAQLKIGLAYYSGRGVSADSTRAAFWLRISADRGDAIAQLHLGYLYFDGNGVEHDQARAAQLFRQAADQGIADAQYRTGNAFYYGYGVTADPETAMFWLQKAAEQSHGEAHNEIGTCYHRGYGVEKNERTAIEWFRRSAELGNANGQYNLGYYYFRGLAVEQDRAEAVRWFIKSASQGSAAAQYNLAQCYLNGFGVPQSLVEGKRWLRKSAEQGNPDAKKALEGL